VGGGMACGHRAFCETDCAFCGKRPPMPPGIDGATGKVTSVSSPVASENLPPAAFHSLRGTVDEGRETKDGGVKAGNLSFGGKGHQPGNRAFRCRGCGLYELFPDV